MTGLNVLEVNVHVQGVSTTQMDDKKEDVKEEKAENAENLEEKKKSKKNN